MPILNKPRRIFLAAATAAITAKVFFQFRGPKTDEDSLQASIPPAFVAFVDVLIPADMTPSASALAVHIKIVERSLSVANYPDLLNQGNNWLDETSIRRWGQDFDNVSISRQQEVVEIASKSQVGTLPQVFFTWVRDDAMQFYYSNPKSWQGLAISQPIQPQGYPDFRSRPTVS